MKDEINLSKYPKRRNDYNGSRLPDQRKRTVEKFKIDKDIDETVPAFIRECVDALDNNDSLYRRDWINTEEVARNYNIIQGEPDLNEIEDVCNTFGLVYDRTHHYYDILKPRVTALANEALTLRKEYRATLLNSEALSQKENDMKKKTLEFFQRLVTQKGLTKEEAQRQIEANEEYMLYDYRDIREEYAQHIMNFYANELDLHDLISNSVIDLLCSNRIIYALDIEYNSLVLRKPDILNVQVWMPIGEYDLRKALAIKEIQYMTETELLIHFGDVLTDEDRKTIRECFDGTVYNNFGERWSTSNVFYTGNKKVSDQSWGDVEVFARYNVNDKRNYIENDTIRVAYHTWLSERLVLEVHKIDQSTGNEIVTLEDEDYIVDDENGEWFIERWIPEYWGAIEIGEFCIIKYGPKAQQYRKQDNYGDVQSGYFGTVGLVNDKFSKPIISAVRKEAYQYSFFRQKFLDAIKKDKGKLAVINKAMIPDAYLDKEDEYLYASMTAGFALKDNNSGNANGIPNGQKLSDEIIDMTQDADIEKAIAAMQYTKNAIDEYIGMSPQRLAQVQGGDGKGTTEQAINTSMVITRNIHVTIDKVKREILEGIIELSKVILKNNNKTVQRITSDMGQHAITIDVDLLMDCDLGIMVTNSTNDLENDRTIKEIVARALATKSITLSQAMELLTNNSYHAVLRKIQLAEKKQEESQSKQMEAQMQSENKKIQLEEAKINNDHQYNMELIKLKNREIDSKEGINESNNRIKEVIASAKNYTDIETSGIKATGFQNEPDVNQDGKSDVQDMVERSRLELDSNKAMNELQFKIEELKFKKSQSENQDAIDKAGILINVQQLKDKNNKK